MTSNRPDGPPPPPSAEQLAELERERQANLDAYSTKLVHIRRILSDRRLSAQEAIDKLHALFVEGRPLGEMPR